MTEKEELDRFRRAVRKGPGTLRWLVFGGLEGLAMDAVVEVLGMVFGATAAAAGELVALVVVWSRSRGRQRR